MNAPADEEKILKEVDQKDLALSLKATSEELKQKIFGNMSERAAEMLKEELELTGPVRILSHRFFDAHLQST